MPHDEELARDVLNLKRKGTQVPPPLVQAALDQFNVGSDYNRRLAPVYFLSQPGFDWNGLNVADPGGGTFVSLGDLAELGFGDPKSVANTLSHELYHQRFRKLPAELQAKLAQQLANPLYTPQIDFKARMREAAVQHPEWVNPSANYSLREALRLVQSPAPEKRKRGLDELVANLEGYAGALPKGTALTDTPWGQAVLGQQPVKDFFFYRTSLPWGGLWEGQVQVQPTMRERIQEGLNTFGQYIPIQINLEGLGLGSRHPFIQLGFGKEKR